MNTLILNFNKMSREKFFKKFQKDKPLYFKYDFENVVVRWQPLTNNYYVKFKSEYEFLAKQGSNIIYEAVQEQNEITESDYNAY